MTPPLMRLLLLLAPMAPHFAAEAWEQRHGEGSRVHAQSWPSFDESLVRAERVTMVVQVDGKVRDRIEVTPDVSEDEAVRLALSSDKVIEALDGATPTRVVARPPRLVNVVNVAFADHLQGAQRREHFLPASAVHAIRGVEAHPGDEVPVAGHEFGGQVLEGCHHGKGVHHVVVDQLGHLHPFTSLGQPLSSVCTSCHPCRASTGRRQASIRKRRAAS